MEEKNQFFFFFYKKELSFGFGGAQYDFGHVIVTCRQKDLSLSGLGGGG